jgi:hypothetical protein
LATNIAIVRRRSVIGGPCPPKSVRHFLGNLCIFTRFFSIQLWEKSTKRLISNHLKFQNSTLLPLPTQHRTLDFNHPSKLPLLGPKISLHQMEEFKLMIISWSPIKREGK